jgi:predicted alpha/beta hydrolase family esterase
MEGRGYTTWVPDLPDAHEPDPDTYLQFIHDHGWLCNSKSVLVGHSLGAVAILHLLQSLAEGEKVDTVVLVGAFKDNLNRPELSRLFTKVLDFESICQKARRFVLIHSDNDPYCPLAHAEYLAHELRGELIVIPGEAHFSISTAGEKYREFPELLEILFPA